MKKLFWRSSSGFTLIEVLIAIFVLTVGIVAVLQAFPLGAHIQKSSKMMTIAIQLNQEKLEEVISQSYSEILLGVVEEPYGFNPDFDSFRRRTEITYFDPNNPGVVPASDLGIKKITVWVFWRSALEISEKEVKIATLFARR